MIYLKVQENEYPAYISGRPIDRDWDGRASKSITLTMTHAQARSCLRTAFGRSSSGRRCRTARTAAGPRPCRNGTMPTTASRGPITDHCDGTPDGQDDGKYTQLEEALRQIGEALA